MSFFVMPSPFTGVGRFKMVQSLSALSSRPKGTMSLSYNAPYNRLLDGGQVYTFLKRPRTGLCLGHLTKIDIHMLLSNQLCRIFGIERSFV